MNQQPTPDPLTTLTTNLQLTLSDATHNIARTLYAQTAHLHNGQSLHHIAAACTYLAAKQCNDPITPEQLIDATPDTLTRKYLLQLTKTISNDLNLSINFYNPETYINTYCTELNLPENTHQLASTIATKSTETGIASGRSPSGIAAASTYYACILTNEKRTQQTIGDTANVSEVTIRNIYHKQQNTFGDELTPTTQ